MKILGLDIATSTGVCFLDTAVPPLKWRCFAIEAQGEFGEDKAGDLAVCLKGEIESFGPDFAAIEMPQRSVTRFEKKTRQDLGGEVTKEATINPNALQLHDLGGAVCGLLDILGIGWGLIAPATWRAAYYSKGYKPADGDWKQAAINHAVLQGIALPMQLKARRDAAESAGVASSWSRCTLIPARHRQAFMDLRLGNGRAVA
jgi:hypothetical protein